MSLKQNSQPESRTSPPKKPGDKASSANETKNVEGLPSKKPSDKASSDNEAKNVEGLPDNDRLNIQLKQKIHSRTFQEKTRKIYPILPTQMRMHRANVQMQQLRGTTDCSP